MGQIPAIFAFLLLFGTVAGRDYSIQQKRTASDYMFDEVRIPISVDSNVDRATGLL